MSDISNLNEEVRYTTDHSTAPSWQDRTQTLAYLGFGVLIIAIIFAVWAVIPFALATVVISYLLSPITDFITRWITFGQRGIAVALTYLLIVIIILVSVLAVLPPLLDQTANALTSLWNNATRLVTEPIIIGETAILENDDNESISILNFIELTAEQEGFANITEWIEANLGELNIDRETVQQLFSTSGNIATGLLGSVLGIAGSAIGFALNLLFFLAISGAMLGNGRQMVSLIIQGAPDDYQSDVRRLLEDLGGVWDGYVRGNLTLGLIMGAGMWVIATILGLPNPLFLAVVAGVMEFIPNIGPTIVMVIAGAVALISGSSTFPDLNVFLLTGLVILIWFIMQQIEATVLVPRIQGENLKLHPTIVILAVIWGGSFGGLIGIIIAPPIIASTRIVVRYLYGRLTGRVAFDSREKAGESINRNRRALIFLRIRRYFEEVFQSNRSS